MSNIQIETSKDNIVNTQPTLRIDMSNIELAPEEPASKPRIEIPERTSRPTFDSDSSDEGKLDAKELDFAVNKKKFNPVAKETIDVKDAKSGPIDTQSQHSVKLPRPINNNDTDSERSRKSTKSRRSSGKDDDHVRRDRRNDDYRPRFSSGSGSFAPAAAAPRQDYLNSFLGSNMFSSRKSYETMTGDDIRREKSFFLQQYESKNKDHMYSSKRLTMDNDLEEIRNELEFITRKRELENSMKMWKRGLVLFVDGIVMLNNYANDPFDVDLSDWSRDMHWDVFRAGNYDDVLEEMVEKWRGKMPMSAEWKLAFMMGSSLVYGVMQKKQEQAKMAKRVEEERRMKEQIQNTVRNEIAQMQHLQHLQQQPAPHQGMNAGNAYQSGFIPAPPHRVRQHPRTAREPQPQMTGPSFNDVDILKELEANFIDSTIAGDASTDSSKGDERVSVDSRKSGSAREGNVIQKRGRGRPRKNVQEEKTVGEETTRQEDGDKIISIPINGTPAGVLPRRRGRPKKNALENQNAVVLEL